MENLNLNQEQIMMLRSKYSQMINDIITKMESDISNMKIKKNIINFGIRIIVSGVCGIVGLGIGNIFFNIARNFLYNYNATVGLNSSIANISKIGNFFSMGLGSFFSAGGLVIGFAKKGDLTGYSQKIAEIEDDKQIFLMMEKKCELSDEKFLQFINNLNFSLSSSITSGRMSADVFIDKLVHDLDFFEEYQNKNLINGLLKDKDYESNKKYYKLNDEFREVLKEYFKEIKTILDSLLKEAQDYDRYNKWIEEGKQRTNLYGENQSLQNTPSYQSTYTGYDPQVYSSNPIEYPNTYYNPYNQQPSPVINNGMQSPQYRDSYIPQPQQYHHINMRYVNSYIPPQAMINRNGYNQTGYYRAMYTPNLYNGENNFGNDNFGRQR